MPAMGRWPVVALAVALVLTGCSLAAPDDVPVGTPHEGLPGPAWYLLTIEPDDAIETRDIVLSPYDGVEIRPRDLIGSGGLAATGGADLFALDGHRVVHDIGLPSTLQATVDGRPCEGTVELLEDMESDATLTIEGDRCVLRLDHRHRMEDLHHGLEDADRV
jgi:hypothetical protein